MIEKSPISLPKPSQDQATAPGADSDRSSRARLFEVEIAGVPLRLKSSHDDETVNELVELVDRKVREALPLTKTGSIQNASILASLHLAEEYLLLRRKARVELERLEVRTQKVISELENSRLTGPLQSRFEKADQGKKNQKLENSINYETAPEIDSEAGADAGASRNASSSLNETEISPNSGQRHREPEAGL